MYELDKHYLDGLEELAAEIQNSEELNLYLEEEEEEHYTRLKELFEPRIATIYDEVAANDPLQLVPLELVLLDENFEGLYLPKILGHAVLRGEIDEQVKYAHPQDHFREVLLAICNSPNFEILKKRIGQSIQMGFALSSDIWITNLINGIDNKRVRYFLQAQKLDKYRRPQDRQIGLERYRRQFQSDNFMTAEFPTNTSELPVLFPQLRSFISYRIQIGANNTSIVPPLQEFIAHDEFKGTLPHMEIMGLYAFFFELSEEDHEHLVTHFNDTRKRNPEFSEQFLHFILNLHRNPRLDLDPQADQRLSAVLDKSIKDKLTEYYNLVDIIHSKGYNSEEAQEAIQVFYSRYEGLSVINECVRQTVLRYFAQFIQNLEEDAYTDLFEITKLFPVYMGIFSNQQFNQRIKDLSMAYIEQLMKRYTDKRGKDYQDIKKFVSTAFLDFGFLKEKEIVEMFKTRRKKRPKAV